MEGDLDNICADAAVTPGYLANHAAHVFNRLIDAAMRPYGVSLSLLGPLLLLERRGPMLQRDLVRWSAVAQPAMVALLAKLEKLALVERAPEPSDGRATRILLTPAGSRIAAAGRQALMQTNASGLEGFSAAEAEVFTALLQRLIANFEQSPLK